jgi:hypothetical protein
MTCSLQTWVCVTNEQLTSGRSAPADGAKRLLAGRQNRMPYTNLKLRPISGTKSLMNERWL